MENHQIALVQGQNRQLDASIPSLGFPLGTALLLIIIFSLSGFFSCCYHWDKTRSLRRSFSPDDDQHREEDADLEADGTNNNNIQSPSSKPSQIYPNWKQNTQESMPVIMPGDKIAKFIALPCPCESFRLEKAVVVEVQSMQQTPAPQPLMPPQPQPLVYNHVARFGVYYNGSDI